MIDVQGFILCIYHNCNCLHSWSLMTNGMYAGG